MTTTLDDMPAEEILKRSPDEGLDLIEDAFLDLVVKYDNAKGRVVKAFEREAGERSLFHFAVCHLGYTKLTERYHRPWAEDYLQDNTILRSMYLWPREHYKTTLATIARALWWAVIDPNQEILIGSATASKAQDMLGEIMGHVMFNPILRFIWGDLRDPYAGARATARKKWAANEANIGTRTVVGRHPTWTAIGANTNVVSSHYPKIIIDDLVTRDDRMSDKVRQSHIEWLKDLTSILKADEETGTGLLSFVGTRWHPQDAYNHIAEIINPRLPDDRKYLIQARDCYDVNGESAFPEIKSTEDLKTIEAETEEIVFSANYRNNPILKGVQFFSSAEAEPFLFDYYDADGNMVLDVGRFQMIGACDPKLKSQSSGSSLSAVIQAGVNSAGIIYILNMSILKRGIADTNDLILLWHGQNPFHMFGYETVQFQEMAANELYQDSVTSLAYLPIMNLNQNVPKPIRIGSIQPLLRKGTIRFRRDYRDLPEYKTGMDQLFHYGAYESDDGPDCIEMVIRVARMTGPRGRGSGNAASTGRSSATRTGGKRPSYGGY